MKKMISILLPIFALIVFLLIIFSQYTVQNKFGEQTISTLKEKVEVKFDKFGIPHIHAQNEYDAYKTLGFVMAGDRLYQMDLMRRIVNGSLSEIFGQKLIESDKLLRTLRLKKQAEFIYEKYSKNSNNKVFSYAEAFLEGVHEYIETQPLPIEFIILNYVPKKFEVSDILGISHYMALTFAEGINSDVFNAEMAERLPKEKVEILRVGDQADSDYFTDQKIVRNNFLKNINKSLDLINEKVPLFKGSNSWVVSGKRSSSGYPILANDPHIGVGNPHIFYEAHVRSPNLEVYGHYLPLMPFPVLGHTPHSAWGLTMAEVDDLNIYLEKIDPETNSKVMFKNEWVDLVEYTETIKVKDADDVYLTVKTSPHGPLIDGTKYGVKGKNLSIDWSVHHPENNLFQTLYELPMAKTVDEFKFALSHAAAPSLNVTWANTKGDIAWWVLGKYPKLPKDVKTDIILKGWDGSNEVERYYTIDENPHLVNPESGLIVSANYRPQVLEFAHFDGYWQPAGRYFRIEKLLSAKEIWSAEEFKKIQLDDYIPIKEQLYSKLLAGINQNTLSTLEKSTFNFVKNWDGKSDKNSIGSTFYYLWNYYLLKNIFLDELGKDDFDKFGHTADLMHSFKKLVHNLNHSFWDNIKTDHVESGSEIITLSFKQTVLDLEKQFGTQIKNWRWGRLHKVEYEHSLGKMKPLNLIFNIGPVEANGGRYTINNMGHKVFQNDFKVVHAPATRRIIDLSNPKKTFGIIPTGNSGNPFSDHYRDQLNLYHKGEYREQTMDMNELKKISPIIFVPKEKE